MSVGSVTSGVNSDYAAHSCSSCAAKQAENSGDTAVRKGQVAAEERTSSRRELTKEEAEQVAKLKKRDQEVRAHEAAHMGAGGGVVKGGASYSYQSGPDGRRYAVGGEVGIDLSSVKNNPEATIRKMQRVRSAALAPASPSGQDRAVAAAAAAQEASARAQVQAQKKEAAGGAPGETAASSTKDSSEVKSGYSRTGKETFSETAPSGSAVDIAV